MQIRLNILNVNKYLFAFVDFIMLIISILHMQNTAKRFFQPNFFCSDPIPSNLRG